MQPIHRTRTVHYVYITDESGIDQVFPRVKENLADNPSTHVSLMYAAETASPVFTPELQILARHFPAQFIPFLVDDPQYPFAGQATLEAILNANTCNQLLVRAFGREAFVDTIRGQLLFLGIKKDDIQLHFLR